MKRQLSFFVLMLVLVLFLATIATVIGCQNQTKPPATSPEKDGLVRVDSIHHQYNGNHLHGLGYDSQGKKVFLATHYGLFILKEQGGEWQLFQLGDSRDDYMGFSLHPSNADIMYASGHSVKMGNMGGNMGVIKSEDGGFTFRQIFQGLKGETVDFHSMTISAANPSILYGFFQGGLYRTTDGGNSWELSEASGVSRVGASWGVPYISADPHQEEVVYAATPEGLAVSRDYGDNWKILTTDQQEFASIGADPSNKNRLIAFKPNQGVIISENGGKNWEARNNGLDINSQELVFTFAFDFDDPQKIFLATMYNQVFLTEDGGDTWQKIL